MNENDLYALPNKKREEIEELEAEEERAMCCVDDEEEKGKQEDIECIEDKDANKDLPPGWEKHEGMWKEWGYKETDKRNVCLLQITKVPTTGILNRAQFNVSHHFGPKNKRRNYGHQYYHHQILINITNTKLLGKLKAHFQVR